MTSDKMVNDTKDASGGGVGVIKSNNNQLNTSSSTTVGAESVVIDITQADHHVGEEGQEDKTLKNNEDEDSSSSAPAAAATTADDGGNNNDGTDDSGKENSSNENRKDGDNNIDKESGGNDGSTNASSTNNETKKNHDDDEDYSKLYATYPLKDIREPHDHDVLYGRGGGTNHHPGNKRYRRLVEERKIQYVNSKRLEKPQVALDIIRHWRRDQDPPGRFLKLNEDTGLWDDVGDKKAREKTSQALREKAPILRKQQQECEEAAGGVTMEGELSPDRSEGDSSVVASSSSSGGKVLRKKKSSPVGGREKMVEHGGPQYDDMYGGHHHHHHHNQHGTSPPTPSSPHSDMPMMVDEEEMIFAQGITPIQIQRKGALTPPGGGGGGGRLKTTRFAPGSHPGSGSGGGSSPPIPQLSGGGKTTTKPSKNLQRSSLGRLHSLGTEIPDKNCLDGFSWNDPVEELENSMRGGVGMSDPDLDPDSYVSGSRETSSTGGDGGVPSYKTPDLPPIQLQNMPQPTASAAREWSLTSVGSFNSAFAPVHRSNTPQHHHRHRCERENTREAASASASAVPVPSASRQHSEVQLDEDGYPIHPGPTASSIPHLSSASTRRDHSLGMNPLRHASCQEPASRNDFEYVPRPPPPQHYGGGGSGSGSVVGGEGSGSSNRTSPSRRGSHPSSQQQQQRQGSWHGSSSGGHWNDHHHSPRQQQPQQCQGQTSPQQLSPQEMSHHHGGYSLERGYPAPVPAAGPGPLHCSDSFGGSNNATMSSPYSLEQSPSPYHIGGSGGSSGATRQQRRTQPDNTTTPFDYREQPPPTHLDPLSETLNVRSQSVDSQFNYSHLPRPSSSSSSGSRHHKYNTPPSIGNIGATYSETTKTSAPPTPGSSGLQGHMRQLSVTDSGGGSVSVSVSVGRGASSGSSRQHRRHRSQDDRFPPANRGGVGGGRAAAAAGGRRVVGELSQSWPAISPTSSSSSLGNNNTTSSSGKRRSAPPEHSVVSHNAVGVGGGGVGGGVVRTNRSIPRPMIKRNTSHQNENTTTKKDTKMCRRAGPGRRFSPPNTCTTSTTTAATTTTLPAPSRGVLPREHSLSGNALSQAILDDPLDSVGAVFEDDDRPPPQSKLSPQLSPAPSPSAILAPSTEDDCGVGSGATAAVDGERTALQEEGLSGLPNSIAEINLSGSGVGGGGGGGGGSFDAGSAGVTPRSGVAGTAGPTKPDSLTLNHRSTTMEVFQEFGLSDPNLPWLDGSDGLEELTS